MYGRKQTANHRVIRRECILYIDSREKTSVILTDEFCSRNKNVIEKHATAYRVCVCVCTKSASENDS